MKFTQKQHKNDGSCQEVMPGYSHGLGWPGQAGGERKKQGIGVHSSTAGAGEGRLAALCGENACVCLPDKGHHYHIPQQGCRCQPNNWFYLEYDIQLVNKAFWVSWKDFIYKPAGIPLTETTSSFPFPPHHYFEADSAGSD